MLETLSLLRVKAAGRKLHVNNAYAGELTSRETYDYLMAHDDGMVVDVRTEVEWSSVGVPVLPDDKTSPVLLSWRLLPDMTLNMAFAEKLQQCCSNKATPLFFLCRSGVRSMDAANEMAKRGYLNCFNIVAGFEGCARVAGSSAQVLGWKAEGLPWVLE